MIPYNVQQQMIQDAIAKLPDTFQLRAFPGETFQISRSASYVNDNGEITLYTYILNADGIWRSFAKGSVAELQAEIVKPVKAKPTEPEAEPVASADNDSRPKGIKPVTLRGKRLVKAGFTVLAEVAVHRPNGFSEKAKYGTWYEVLTPSPYPMQAVIGYQSAHCIHAFGKSRWTASGSTEASCINGCLGDVIDTDSQLRGYDRLVRSAPSRLVREYLGL